ncbi:MAG: hypothetical protein ACREBU_26005 [Nitrososphaera sp.]
MIPSSIKFLLDQFIYIWSTLENHDRCNEKLDKLKISMMKIRSRDDTNDLGLASNKEKGKLEETVRHVVEYLDSVSEGDPA